jgi:hypothetical protein
LCCLIFLGLPEIILFEASQMGFIW